jgi:WD40 repeat protein
VCETKIYIFNILNFQNIDTIDTFENSKGIIAMTFDPRINIVAFPDKANGYVKLKSYEKNETILINAHESKISCIQLSQNGKLLATCSEKGTLIRLFKTEDGIFIHQLRRSKDIAEIYNISFDDSTKFISCSCSTGTIHIFSLKIALEKYEGTLKELYFIKIII